MTKKKEEFKYTSPPPIKRSLPKLDPDMKPAKKSYRFDRGPRHNFWSLFKEEE